MRVVLGILSSLVQLSGLFMVGPTAVNGYRGSDLAAAQVGREVDVRYVLGDTVQKAGIAFARPFSSPTSTRTRSSGRNATTGFSTTC